MLTLNLRNWGVGVGGGSVKSLEGKNVLKEQWNIWYNLDNN